jgi:hypothetical protein
VVGLLEQLCELQLVEIFMTFETCSMESEYGRAVRRHESSIGTLKLYKFGKLYAAFFLRVRSKNAPIIWPDLHAIALRFFFRASEECGKLSVQSYTLVTSM